MSGFEPVYAYRASNRQVQSLLTEDREQGMNAFKTTILLSVLTVLLILAGEYLGGSNGAIIAFAIAAVTNFVSYFFSDKIALAMYGAKPVTRDELPRAYEVVERLAGRANIPMPKIFVIPTESPNAFATGRNPQHASVAVTHGILRLLNDEELEGVLAHELGHVRNRDILTSSIAATLAGAITILARMAFWAGMFGGYGGERREREGGGFGGLIMLILAPFAAMLIQLWVSRTREYEADASGAHLTGNPYALASALEKISMASQQVPLIASPSSAHLFIVQPLLSGQSFASLFSTHPPVRKRIEKLIGRPSVYGNLQ
jgi:heat shock protein HtpX